MKYFVYILQSKKDQRYYIGQTAEITKRLAEHNRGKVNSTRYRLPVELVYFEEHLSRLDSIRRERYFKSYKSTKDLLRDLKLKSALPTE